MEQTIEKFRVTQSYVLETMIALREAVRVLASCCDDSSLSPLAEDFERLYFEAVKSRQIMGEAVDILKSVVDDLIPCGHFPDDYIDPGLVWFELDIEPAPIL